MDDDPFPEIEPGIYRHYKGRYYEVLGAARHTEDASEFAVYRPLPPTPYQLGLRVRPLAMFLEEVTWEGKRVPRFRRVGPADAQATKPMGT